MHTVQHRPMDRILNSRQDYSISSLTIKKYIKQSMSNFAGWTEEQMKLFYKCEKNYLIGKIIHLK